MPGGPAGVGPEGAAAIGVTSPASSAAGSTMEEDDEEEGSAGGGGAGPVPRNAAEAAEQLSRLCAMVVVTDGSRCGGGAGRCWRRVGARGGREGAGGGVLGAQASCHLPAPGSRWPEPCLNPAPRPPPLSIPFKPPQGQLRLRAGRDAGLPAALVQDRARRHVRRGGQLRRRPAVRPHDRHGPGPCECWPGFWGDGQSLGRCVYLPCCRPPAGSRLPHLTIPT
jgi:hypothetical protein